MRQLSFSYARALRAGLFALTTLVTVASCATTSQGVFEKTLTGESQVIDLTHPLNATTPPGTDGTPFALVAINSLEKDGQHVNRLSLGETTGTCITAPARVVTTSTPVDRIPPIQLIANGVVIDVTKAVTEKPGYQLSKSDVEIWESQHGPIPPESIVLVYTGWDKRWKDQSRYLNLDSAGKPVFPGVSAEAITFLIRERRVHALGIDTLSIFAGSGNQPGQRDFLNTGKYHIENLTRLDELPAKGAVIIAVPLRIEGGTGSPARVLAIIPQNKTAVEPGKKKQEAPQGDPSGMNQGMRQGY